MKEKQSPNFTCLYAHYNEQGKVSKYVITFLKSLSLINSKIIFISNSPIDSDSQQLLLSQIGDISIHIRENKGYDFGAWKWAIENKLISTDCMDLLLANDSFIGPLTDIESVLASMQQRKVDFWGLTDTLINGWHIEPYFFMLSKKVWKSKIFTDFFNQDFANMSKEEINLNAGKELTSQLVNEGFSNSAYVPYKEIDNSRGNTDSFKDPTIFFADRLIAEYNFPFLKKRLIFNDQENIKIGGLVIFDLIRKYSAYDLDNVNELIEGACKADLEKKIPAPVSVVCHLYYPHTIFSFLIKLSSLKRINASFILNISFTLSVECEFLNILKGCFPDGTFLVSPPLGRDIGGKLAALGVLLKKDIPGKYTLIIHDKLSPHSPLGTKWRDELLKIITAKNVLRVISKFERNEEIGLITAENSIQNEYNPDNKTFRCTSSEILVGLIKKFNLEIDNYNFSAGSIFWIRTSVLKSFFEKNKPLKIRETLEAGNVLDFNNGTQVHAWERLISFLPNAYGLKISGI